MKRSIPFILACSTLAFLTAGILAQETPYPWTDDYQAQQALVRRISLPHGFRRTPLESGSFGHWLRDLPLKEGSPPVLLHDGTRKPNQDAHVAVLNIDVGHRDLQQCADAIIRLRAEYLFASGAGQAIVFNFTSGEPARFRDWARGMRPRLRGNTVSWVRSSRKDRSYRNFRDYLNTVFVYAGSHSLEKELNPVREIACMKIGDVFIQGGFPGHAVLVVDMAIHEISGQKIFLLVQSYMPAQDIHILKNPLNSSLSPWYNLDFGFRLQTPEWNFRSIDLRRF